MNTDKTNDCQLRLPEGDVCRFLQKVEDPYHGDLHDISIITYIYIYVIQIYTVHTCMHAYTHSITLH